jgi:hypothetical protein
MMIKRRFFPSLVLLAVFLASCTPASATATPVPEATTVTEPIATALPATQPVLDSPTETLPASATETLAPTALPVATSRGPDLHATDPTTVDLASGQIQFVEFFRFT